MFYKRGLERPFNTQLIRRARSGKSDSRIKRFDNEATGLAGFSFTGFWLTEAYHPADGRQSKIV
jgi:hypothetical protein